MTDSPLLALHLGVVSGWAFGERDPAYGAWRLADNARTDPGEIGAAFLDALGDFCSVYGRPSCIALTAPLVAAHDEDSAKAQIIVIGLTMACRIYAYRKAIPVVIPAIEQMKQEILAGKNLGTWCREQGFEPKHDTAAYALLLHSYAKRLRR